MHIEGPKFVYPGSPVKMVSGSRARGSPLSKIFERCSVFILGKMDQWFLLNKCSSKPQN